MFSRLSRSPILALAAVASAVALGGCSIHEKPPESSQFDIKTTQLECLDKAGDQVKSYFEGKASAADVDAVWSCASSALDDFVSKTVGAQPGVYSAQELSDFFARYFVHEVPLTPDLVAQIGKLKQVLVGGAQDQLTVDEIQRMKQLFEVLRAQSQNLRTFMPLMPPSSAGSSSNGAWTGIGGLRWSQIDESYLDGFSGALMSAAKAIGGALDSTATPYTFDQLDSLIQALLNALPSNGDFNGTIQALSSVHENLNLIRAAKNTLLVPESAANSGVLSDGKDWTELLANTVDWADLAVRMSWLMDSDRMAAAQEQIDQGAGLVHFGKLFDRAQSLLMKAVKEHPGGIITFDELDQLVDALPAASLPAPAHDIELTFRPLIRRFIGGTDLGLDGRGATGITPGILSKLSDIFHNWYEGQRFLETLFQNIEKQEEDQDGAGYFRDTLLTSPVATALWNQVLQQSDPQWNPNTRLAAERLQKIITALRPLFFGSDNEITFPKYSEGLRYSFNDLATLNWMQSLSRLLVRGYAEGAVDSATGIPERAEADNWQPGSASMTGAGVNLEEFQQAFSDLKPLGVDLKFFSPDSPNAAYDRFREGDVFTYVSDGNGYLDMNEAATLLAFAVSAKRKAARIHQDIAENCHTQVLDPIYQEPLIDYSCYTGLFYGQAQAYWDKDKLGEMVSYFQGLSDPLKAQFQQLLETSARQNGYQPGVAMTIDDTEDMVASLQYIEAMFTRYDVNDSGYLTPTEATVAFPVFKGVLEQMGKAMNPPIDLDDSSANLVFTYMLAKGELPSGTWDVVWWDIEKHLPLLGHFKADRMRILQIFAALSDSSGGTPTGPVPVTTISSPAPEASPGASP